VAANPLLPRHDHPLQPWLRTIATTPLVENADPKTRTAMLHGALFRGHYLISRTLTSTSPSFRSGHWVRRSE